jgi:hypothetical protein
MDYWWGIALTLLVLLLFTSSRLVLHRVYEETLLPDFQYYSVYCFTTRTM